MTDLERIVDTVKKDPMLFYLIAYLGSRHVVRIHFLETNETAYLAERPKGANPNED